MTEQTALYRHLGENWLLLYVGISRDVTRRWRDEARQFSWWPDVRYQTVELYPTWAEARKAERQAIRSEEPLHNIADTPRMFKPTRPLVPVAAFDCLVGTAEISRMLGVSRQRVLQIAGDVAFPEPCEVLAMGKIWVTADVATWATEEGRVPTPG